MTCKFVRGKDFTAFVCSNIGENYLNDGILDPDKDSSLEPYSRYECDHHRTNQDKTKCLDCGAEYDENRLMWVKGE